MDMEHDGLTALCNLRNQRRLCKCALEEPGKWKYLMSESEGYGLRPIGILTLHIRTRKSADHFQRFTGRSPLVLGAEGSP